MCVATVALSSGARTSTRWLYGSSRTEIAAGAFHNDVVAVANERVLFTHEQAFADPSGTYAAIRERLPAAEFVVVPAAEVSLADGTITAEGTAKMAVVE